VRFDGDHAISGWNVHVGTAIRLRLDGQGTSGLREDLLPGPGPSHKAHGIASKCPVSRLRLESRQLRILWSPGTSATDG